MTYILFNTNVRLESKTTTKPLYSMTEFIPMFNFKNCVYEKTIFSRYYELFRLNIL